MANAKTIGMAAAVATAMIAAVYAVVLVIGLVQLPSPSTPIADPWFTVMELLILMMMPVIIALMVAVHRVTDAEVKVFSMIALVFVSMSATVTSLVHFSIMVLSRLPSFVGMPEIFAFTWPSVAYAFDILAWDVFFALGLLAAAPVFGGSRTGKAARWLLVIAGVLSFAGLAGLPGGDMRLRNIGVVGYAGVFPMAAAAIALWFRSRPG